MCVYISVYIYKDVCVGFLFFLFLLIYAKPLLPGMSAIKLKKKFIKINSKNKKQKNNLIHHTFSRIPRKNQGMEIVIFFNFSVAFDAPLHENLNLFLCFLFMSLYSADVSECFFPSVIFDDS